MPSRRGPGRPRKRGRRPKTASLSLQDARTRIQELEQKLADANKTIIRQQQTVTDTNRLLKERDTKIEYLEGTIEWTRKHYEKRMSDQYDDLDDIRVSELEEAHAMHRGERENDQMFIRNLEDRQRELQQTLETIQSKLNDARLQRKRAHARVYQKQYRKVLSNNTISIRSVL